MMPEHLSEFSRSPFIPISKTQASRWAGLLLFVLAGVVVITTALSLRYGIRPEASCLGIGITVAALVVMPVLAWLKRKTAWATKNCALAADAVRTPLSESIGLIG